MKPVISILIIATILFSCKKTKDDGTTGALLASTVTSIGGSSYTYVYTYNSSNKLIGINYDSKWQGVDNAYQMNIERNSQNIFHTISYYGKDPNSGVENLKYKMKYDTVSNRYTNAIATYTYNGQSYTDSVFCIYDASGKLIKEEIFKLNSGNYDKSQLKEYTYNNSNLVNSKKSIYESNTDSYKIIEERTFEYDDKINPLRLENEAFFSGFPELTSVNNVTKNIYVHHYDNNRNSTISISYKYNADNKPLSAALTFPNRAVLTTTYKYKNNQ